MDDFSQDELQSLEHGASMADVMTVRAARLKREAAAEAHALILAAGERAAAQPRRHVRFEHGGRRDLAAMRVAGKRAYDRAMAARGVPPAIYARAKFWDD